MQSEPYITGLYRGADSSGDKPVNEIRCGRVVGPLVVLILPGLSGCADDRPTGTSAQTTQAAFWRELADRCGSSYAGQATIVPEGDSVVAGRELVMHVMECGEDAIRIPFHVDDNRSRTWVLTRSDSSLALAHDHRHQDGTPESNSGYGGETVVPGTPRSQAFPAGRPAGELEHPDSTNVWTMEFESEDRFVYGFHRTGTDRRYRIEFDMTETVPTPPPPWGR